MNSQLDHLLGCYSQLAVCRSDVEKAFGIMRDCFRSGGKVLLCGNGGSAADADHWAGELLKGFRRKRSLNEAEQRSLSAELAIKLQGALPAIPLTSFPSLSTAFANDVDPQLAFAQLVWGLGRPGDVLVGLSTSGKSRNVCAALEAAQARGMLRIGLAGRSGFWPDSLCDVCIKAPADETYQVQELHLPIYHCLSLMLEEEFFGQENGN
jgi:D-sedoheptulose 7-phosphate isomerase